MSLFERTKKSLPKPAEPATEDEKEELDDSDLDDFFGNEEEEKPKEEVKEEVKEEKPKEEEKEAISDYSYSYSDYSYSYSDYS